MDDDDHKRLLSSIRGLRFLAEDWCSELESIAEGDDWAKVKDAADAWGILNAEARDVLDKMVDEWRRSLRRELASEE